MYAGELVEQGTDEEAQRDPITHEVGDAPLFGEAGRLEGGGRVVDVHCGGGRWLIAGRSAHPATTGRVPSFPARSRSG